MPVINPLPSDINKLIDESIKSYGEFPRNINIETDYEESIPQISIDPDQMRRAFFNIIKKCY